MILCDCAKEKCYCENLNYVFLIVIILVLIAILIVFIFLTIKIDDEEINNKKVNISVSSLTDVLSFIAVFSLFGIVISSYIGRKND